MRERSFSYLNLPPGPKWNLGGRSNTKSNGSQRKTNGILNAAGTENIRERTPFRNFFRQTAQERENQSGGKNECGRRPQARFRSAAAAYGGARTTRDVLPASFQLSFQSVFSVLNTRSAQRSAFRHALAMLKKGGVNPPPFSRLTYECPAWQ